MEIGADVRQSLKGGDLAAAVEQAKRLVRNDPASVKPRILLFQLFSLLGDWERALTQLNVVGELAADTVPMVCTYRGMLTGEPLRARVFAGNETPIVLGQPENWLALLIEALRLDGLGEASAAAGLRAKAFDEAPATSGTVDGTAFGWIADGDQRLGPVLEAVVNGRYCWIPLHRIRTIEVEPPSDLRDLVWMSVTLTFANGGQVMGLVPARYPGTPETGDPQLRLGRRTDWEESPAGLLTGLGQRMLVTDVGEHALMDVRRIDLEVADAPAPADPAGDAHG